MAAGIVDFALDKHGNSKLDVVASNTGFECFAAFKKSPQYRFTYCSLCYSHLLLKPVVFQIFRLVTFAPCVLEHAS